MRSLVSAPAQLTSTVSAIIIPAPALARAAAWAWAVLVVALVEATAGHCVAGRVLVVRGGAALGDRVQRDGSGWDGGSVAGESEGESCEEEEDEGGLEKHWWRGAVV